MKTLRSWIGALCLILVGTQVPTAHAQMRPPGPAPVQTVFPSSVVVEGPGSAPTTAFPSTSYIVQGPAAPAAPMPSTPQAPGRPAMGPDAGAPPSDAFTQAPPSGTESPGGGFAPQMIGDSLGYVSGRLPANLRPGLILSDNSITGSAPIALSGSAFKIADNDSPRPQDRVYLDVNYFTAVLNSLKAPGGATQTFVRETFGFESTFLDGNASIEMRVPFFQTHLDSGVVAGAATSASDFGDVTLIGKYVLWSDPGTGSLLSTGVALTLPTGPTYNVTLTNAVTGAVVRTDSVNPTIFQPFVGFMYFLSENLYVHGFSSLAIPFSESVSTDWFNDIGVGWYAWRDGNCSLNAIVPTAELHIETPFGNQGVFSYPIGELDTWVVTLGVHLQMHNHSEITFAYETPLSGPRPFQSEYVCQFNYHF